MSHLQKILPHYTYDDYVHLEGRWELLEGHPIAMIPLPVPKHQRAAAALNAEFVIALKKKKCKHCYVYNPLDYKISEDTILQPDMLVVCGEITKKFLDFPPALVVEIFSPSTVIRDKNTKFYKYQEQGVKYYLMVDVERETFELYELRKGEYVLANHNFDEPFLFILNNDCSIEVALNAIWED